MSKYNSQDGQTLVEVIVAIFVLTMALVAGLGLAIYANSRNLNNRNLIIATNLAREGIETARIARDTNWLAAEDPTPTGQNAPVDDLYTQAGGCSYGSGNSNRRPCYPEAFVLPYDLTARTDWRATLDLNNSNSPNLILRWQTTGGESMLMCLDPNTGLYSHSNSCTLSNFNFARQVTIANNTSSPFTSASSNPTSSSGHSPEKIITSTVVWRGKGCAAVTNASSITSVPGPCKIQIVERLSNWKDYR